MLFAPVRVQTNASSLKPDFQMTFIGLIRGQGSCCEFAVLQNQEGAWSQLSPSQTILLREKPVTLKDIQVEIFCVGLFSVLFLTRRKGHM